LPNPALEVSLRHQAGPLDLDVQFTLDAPWTCLFAPSGAGKTTILRMIAGLDRPDKGRVLCLFPGTSRQSLLLDTEGGIDLPPHKRGIRMVAQRPALFPHLSALRNIRYQLKTRAPRDEEERAAYEQRFESLLSLCRIAPLRDKMPSQLSGGERQRVALARTLASFPADLLLLDEPFTGLEADLRDDIIRDLRAWTAERSIPVLLVTHDLGEVFAADPHVLKMEAGHIVASGPAAEVLAPERDRLLARLEQRQHESHG